MRDKSWATARSAGDVVDYGVSSGMPDEPLCGTEAMPAELSLGTRLSVLSARVRADLTLAAIDVVLVVGALGAALLLRFDGSVPPEFWGRFAASIPTAACLTVGVNWLWGLYGQMWRHASVLEARRIILAGMVTAALMSVRMGLGGPVLPRSALVMGCLLYIALAGLVRFQQRLFALGQRTSGRDKPGLRVLILGADDAAAALVREMVRSPRCGLVPVGILDDDPRAHRRSCMGVRIEGSMADLPEVAARLGAHQVVLAVEHPTPELARRAADLAQAAGVPLRVLPGIAERVKGEVHIQDLRDLRIEDLLGRPQVPIDLAGVRCMLAGKRVLVTGAGGSIGSEIVRQVAHCAPAQLLVLDHDETHLHELCADLGYPAVQLLADIRDRDVIDRLFERHRPQIVFHAAAHKHVPVLESHPGEALRTNVLGTQHLVDAAATTGVERFVFISTDKAVRPSSVMGASKRVAEHLVLGHSGGATAFCAVRFGNVLGSRGSVIPTFLRQLKAGGPLTITDPQMTRFFMSIPEAVQLVLQSASMAVGGEVFILEMGEPVRIMDLAERMIRLTGRRPGRDVEIRITGTRPGEKLFEELHEPEESLMATAHATIGHIRPEPIPPAVLRGELQRLRGPLDGGDDEEIRRSLHRLAGGVVEPRKEAPLLQPGPDRNPQAPGCVLVPPGPGDHAGRYNTTTTTTTTTAGAVIGLRNDGGHS